jgi:hypothetical protein
MCNCPYFNSKVDKLKRINCRRGQATEKFEGKGYGKQINNYCNGTYTQCWCYKALEKAWGHAQIN